MTTGTVLIGVISVLAVAALWWHVVGVGLPYLPRFLRGPSTDERTRGLLDEWRRRQADRSAPPS